MRMIYEANASSSACRLWRVHLVETSAPPSKISGNSIILQFPSRVKLMKMRSANGKAGNDLLPVHRGDDAVQKVTGLRSFQIPGASAATAEKYSASAGWI